MNCRQSLAVSVQARQDRGHQDGLPGRDFDTSRPDLDMLHDTTSRNAVEKKTVLENLDLILLAMDEIVEGGCVASMSFCRGLEVSNKVALSVIFL